MPAHAWRAVSLQKAIRDLEAPKFTCDVNAVSKTFPANARRAWLEMGQPHRPLPRQVEPLELASALIAAPIRFDLDDKAATFELEVPPQGVLLLSVDL